MIVGMSRFELFAYLDEKPCRDCSPAQIWGEFRSGQGERVFPGRIDPEQRPQPVAEGTRLGGLGDGFGLRCGWEGSAAQPQGAQKPLSLAGQGPGQDSRVLQCGAHSLPACCAAKAEADPDA